MSLKPLLSSLTGRLTEEAHQYVRTAGASYLKRLRAGCSACGENNGRALCPSCFTHITCGPGCQECLAYRGANQGAPSHKPTQRRR